MGRTLSSILAAIALSGLTACGQGQSAQEDRPWDTALAESGLAAAEASLMADTRSAETGFLLGSVRFLRAFEHILQVRYANDSGALEIIPGMRTELPPNPDGAFDPAFLETALTGALGHLEGASDALAPAQDGTFAVDIDLTKVWLDVNQDGARQDWEGLLSLLGQTGVIGGDAEGFEGVIRFDTADAEWLAAYVRLISGVSEMVLSVDPTPAIAEVYEGRLAMDAFADEAGYSRNMFLDEDQIDTLAAVLVALNGVPDSTRTRAALAHFRGMIEDNRSFWSEVMEETDNEREWLPNPAQQSVFGVEVTEELATSWQDVLAEMEQVFNGEVLVPFWRVQQPFDAETGVGINIESLLTDPGDLNVALMIQGSAFAPHLERGQLSQLESMDRFMTMTRGDGLLFALWFN